MSVIMSLTVPKAFKDGAQFDENGDVIPGSWPMPFPHDGVLAWIAHGVENAGRVLVDALLTDEAYPEWDTGLPSGWVNSGCHKWNMGDRDEHDENGDLVSSGLDTLTVTDQTEYKKHMPDPVDENGDPTGDPVTYHRQHKFLGWPDVRD